MLNARQQRGLEIAQVARIVRKGRTWMVPSLTHTGRRHTVRLEDTPHCTCADHETSGGKCKHIHAVQYLLLDKQDEISLPLKSAAPKPDQKPTYPQNWAAYTRVRRHKTSITFSL